MTCNYKKTRDVWQACGVTEWSGAVGSSVETEFALPTVGRETGDLVQDFWLTPESEERTVLINRVEGGEPFGED